MAAEIKTYALGGEISDKTAPAMVDALGKVLKKEIDGIKKQAATTKGKLKTPKNVKAYDFHNMFNYVKCP